MDWEAPSRRLSIPPDEMRVNEADYVNENWSPSSGLAQALADVGWQVTGKICESER
jgi:hypothetical protein